MISKLFSCIHKRQPLPLFILLWSIFTVSLFAQNIFIVVIDGARYSETFGADSTYIPRIWNNLRPQGTIYINFRNEGKTQTCPGHASILTGTWQKLLNDGSQRCTKPTLFEYYRKEAAAPESSCYIVSGKPKLEMIAYSTDKEYGSPYKARFVTNTLHSDTATWKQLTKVMDAQHPRLVLVNFPEVDEKGHKGDWKMYVHSLHQIDSLIFLLWNKIQSDSIYRNTTTLFITNDHGRHDDQHGGFKEHGDSCNGCRHIILLALGPQFIPEAIVSKAYSQIDIAPTAGEILGIKLKNAKGNSLLK